MPDKVYQPVVLVILDGWGVAPPSVGNAIALAKKPNFDSFLANYPAFTLQASGESVGLPWGEMGNSEVGHLSMGSGKILYQSLPRITKSITDGSFARNQAFLSAFSHVKKNNSSLHIMGLVSDGGIHAYNEHLYALLEVARDNKIENIFIHAFLDGRDTPRDSGIKYIQQLQKVINVVGVGKIATMAGRFWAMDRDNHWERIEAAYNAIVLGESKYYTEDPVLFIKESYQRGVFDEEFYPTVITSNNKPIATVDDGDAVIFFNFRADRARQLTKAFVLPDFDGFNRKKVVADLYFVTMTEYEKGLPVEVAFPPEKVTNPLAKVLSDHGIKQLHIAETEKYAHVTYFFNGGIEKPFPGEDHLMIPSPRVVSYAEKPEMSAPEITKEVVKAITTGKYGFIVVNFANADMVGHTGDLNATIKAIETLDKCLGDIAQAVLAKKGVMLITADHGNAEELIKLRTGDIDKEHSSSPVPFVIIGEKWLGQGRAGDDLDLSSTTPVGVLADVAPTVLSLFGIKPPDEMTGKSLV